MMREDEKQLVILFGMAILGLVVLTVLMILAGIVTGKK